MAGQGLTGARGRIDILLEGYDAWNRGDVEAGLAYFAEDAEWFGPSRSPFAGPYRGRRSIERFFRSMLELFEELRREPIGFEEHGDTVLVRVRSYARGMGSGAGVEVMLTDVWTFRGAGVVRYQVFDRHEDALRESRRGDSNP